MCWWYMYGHYEIFVWRKSPITKSNINEGFKMVSESIKSMLSRYVGNEHKLQKLVDKFVVSKKKGKSLFNYVIDFENLPKWIP